MLLDILLKKVNFMMYVDKELENFSEKLKMLMTKLKLIVFGLKKCYLFL